MVVTQKVVLVVFGKGIGEDIFRRRLLKELVQSCLFPLKFPSYYFRIVAQWE